MKSPLKQEKKRILITQTKPQSEKSPYFDLEKKHEVSLVFHPLSTIEGVSAKEFRRQKIDITTYSAVIFTSRHAIDHFFRLCEEMKTTISQDTKYFCITEAVALYLQKFILYRKRKVFFGANGTNQSLLDVINKHKANETFLYITSENPEENSIMTWLKNSKSVYNNGSMYRNVDNGTKEILTAAHYDIICLFTPGSVKQIQESFPEFQQKDTAIATFGNNTEKAATEAGWKVDISAPTPQTPNMGAALDQYLSKDLVSQ